LETINNMTTITIITTTQQNSIHIRFTVFILMSNQSMNVGMCSVLTSGLVMNLASMYAAESTDLSSASK